jgi:nitrogen fixation NifU-like protein
VSATLHNLYRDLLVDHSKRPHNFRRLGARAALAEEYNPLCGDSVTVYVELADGVLHDVAFQGVGCAVATASASLMTEAVQGRSPGAVAELCDSFRALVSDGVEPAAVEALGSLAVFAGVRAYPSRVKCALLPWRALRTALQRSA